MSAIFISHSSADNEAASRAATRLAGQGHRSVFLDFDPALGIPAGRQWEQELYNQLRICQAVVVLCSRMSMASAWCFAEITFARALGKPIFPLKIDDCTVPNLLDGLQVTDLARDAESGYKRLFSGLLKAGLDPASAFDWDGSRSPYPGLLPLLKADAAIFFGRDAAVHSTLETLNRLQRLGGARLVTVLGASGSGKSSLVRAGVVPRLERDRDRWLVTEPFRPLSHPYDGLAMALAGLVPGRDWKSIRGSFDSGAAWRDLVNDLRQAAGRPEAAVIVVIDQFEELLGQAPRGQHSGFLRLLRTMIAEEAGSLFVVATLRSDFLAAFQSHPELQGVSHESIALPLIQDLALVIEGPARLAGIELEPGLVQAMVNDAHSGQALPLLAFTLRELWDRFGAQRRFSIRQYRDELGGLRGAVGRAAESVCDVAKLPAAEAVLLRKALLRLVRIDPESRYVRQRRAWSDLPPQVHGLLEQFVKARLLVSKEDPGRPKEVEVAHEALFSAWTALEGWLKADLAFLQWRESLRGDVAAWLDNSRHPSQLARGPVLAKAEAWLAQRADELDAVEREFIAAGVAERDAESAALERSRRRRMSTLAAAVVFFGALSALAGWQWHQANQQRNLARSHELAAVAEGQMATDPERAVLIAIAALDERKTPRAESALRSGLQQIQRRLLVGHRGAVRSVAISDDGRRLLTAGRDGEARIWDSDTGRSVRTLSAGLGSIYAATLSHDGRRAWTVGEDAIVRVWDAETGTLLGELRGHHGPVYSVAPGKDSQRMASGGSDGTVRIWDVSHEAPLLVIKTWVDDDAHPAVRSLAFSADGHRIVAAGEAFEATVWDATDGRLLARLPHAAMVVGAALSPDGHQVVTASGDFVRSWSVEEARVRWESKRDSPMHAVAFDASGRHVVAGQSSGRVLVLRAESGQLERALIGHATVVRSVAFGPDDLLASAGDDMTARLWRWSSLAPALTLPGHLGNVGNAAFSPDARQAITASTDRQVRIWDLATGQLASAFKADDDEVISALFSPDGRSVVTAGAAGTARVWLPDGTLRHELPGHAPPVNSASFSADSRQVVTAGKDGFVRVFSARTGELECKTGSHGSEVYAAAFSPDGRLLAAGSADGMLRVWSASDVGLLRQVPAHAQAVYGVAFSPDGTRIATAGLDGKVRIFGTSDLAEIRSLAHQGHVLSVEFSRTGDFIATASSDNTARIWEEATGRLVMAFSVDSGLRAASFRPDGQAIIVAGGGNSARIVVCDVCVPQSELVALARRNIRRQLSPEEKAVYLRDSSFYRPVITTSGNLR